MVNGVERVLAPCRLKTVVGYSTTEATGMAYSRRFVQLAFLLLTLAGVFLFRANAEQWCPFGGVEALYTYACEGNVVCSLGVSNFYILAGVLISVLVLRRAFCSHLCPIGTLSEWLHLLGRQIGQPGCRVTGRLDRAFSLLKYALLAVILFFTWRSGELLFRGYDPCYALLSRHGADITVWAYVSAGVLAAASLLLILPFCRWLCPLAAVLNPFSRFGLLRIKRDPQTCTSCGRCSRACPMEIPVDQLSEVAVARCIACLNCTDACPHQDPPALVWGPRAALGSRWPRAALVSLLFFFTATAVAAAYLVPLPSFVSTQGTEPAQTAVLQLRMHDLTCRGRANLLVGLLRRDDMFQIPGPAVGEPGFYRLEAWPAPEVARIRLYYDPACATEELLKQAITEPYYDLAADRWWMSPFVIDGYDPLSLNAEGLHPGLHHPPGR